MSEMVKECELGLERRENGGERVRERKKDRLEKKERKRGLNQGLCVSSLENVTTFWKTLPTFCKILCYFVKNVTNV